jgi:hypothetical protein
MKERSHLGNLNIDKRIIIMYLKERGLKGMYWMCLAQDMDRGHVLVNKVTKHSFHVIR